MKKSNVAVLRDPHTQELIEIKNVNDACKILQRELALRAQRRTRREGYTYKTLAAKAGCCNSTLYRIADGSTKWPQLRTCLLIFHAMGWKVFVGQ
jgi:DNA-binding XRE family transcriptional regulator